MGMEPPLGSILAGIFMVELETSVIPTLGWSLMKWKRYVHNSFFYVNICNVNDILKQLNDFQQSIQFIYKLDK